MRKSWDEYFMEITQLVAQRSTCDRAFVGCVLVNSDHRIVSTVHAEMNALLYCAKEGIPAKGSICYVTHFPCLNCTKALIQAGISAIYYHEAYRVDDYALEILERNNVSLKKI